MELFSFDTVGAFDSPVEMGGGSGGEERAMDEESAVSPNHPTQNPTP